MYNFFTISFKLSKVRSTCCTHSLSLNKRFYLRFQRFLSSPSSISISTRAQLSSRRAVTVARCFDQSIPSRHWSAPYVPLACISPSCSPLSQFTVCVRALLLSFPKRSAVSSHYLVGMRQLLSHHHLWRRASFCL